MTLRLLDHSHVAASSRATTSKRADSVQDCQPLERACCYVPFLDGPLWQDQGFLWPHCPVVDTNVVNQAGPERAGGVILPGTDVQTTGGSCQVALRVFSRRDAINTECSV